MSRRPLSNATPPTDPSQPSWSATADRDFEDVRVRLCRDVALGDVHERRHLVKPSFGVRNRRLRYRFPHCSTTLKNGGFPPSLRSGGFPPKRDCKSDRPLYTAT